MDGRRWARFAGAALALGSLLLTAPSTLSASAASAAIASAGSRGAPAVRWTSCAGRFDCATVAVPLDYGSPHGTQIAVAMIRRPADEPARRLGTIVVDPGGPGASGVDFVYGAAALLFSPEVLVRFDIVGFDPRGVARTSPLSCIHSGDDVSDLNDQPPFPVGAEQQAAAIAAARTYASLCARHGGPILAHMSTADTARDVDRIRAALGESRLNLVGYSYGTELALTYAALFPGRVRAMVLDGVVDPEEWRGPGLRGAGTDTSTGGSVLEQRVRSSDGSQAALDAFLTACDAAGVRRCAIAGDAGRAGHARRVLRETMDLLRAAHPGSDLETGPGAMTTYADFVSSLLSSLYDARSFPALARMIDELHTALITEAPLPLDPISDAPATLAIDLGPGLGVGEQQLPVVAPLPQPVYTSDALLGVLCADTHHPRNPSAWAAAARGHDKRAPGFAELWVWSTLPCAYWPVSVATAVTARVPRPAGVPGALVVSTTFDPATRYGAGVAVARRLPGAHLLTLHGFGHTSAASSACVDRAVARYLLDAWAGRLPADCTGDVAPFDPDPLGVSGGG